MTLDVLHKRLDDEDMKDGGAASSNGLVHNRPYRSKRAVAFTNE